VSSESLCTIKQVETFCRRWRKRIPKPPYRFTHSPSFPLTSWTILGDPLKVTQRGSLAGSFNRKSTIELLIDCIVCYDEDMFGFRIKDCFPGDRGSILFPRIVLLSVLPQPLLLPQPLEAIQVDFPKARQRGSLLLGPDRERRAWVRITLGNGYS